MFINGKSAARLSDTGYTTCPCCGAGYTNVQASTSLFVNGRGIVRVGDGVNIHLQGAGNMVSGSNNFFVAR